MSTTKPTPEERYTEIVQQILTEDSEVTSDPESSIRRFGMNGGMKIAGKLFAFLAKGRLIVKLPKQRVDALIAEGRGEHCEMGRGRIMKEWIVVGPDFQKDWHAHVLESKGFVKAITQEPSR